jgi:DNA-binding SARP family transcriptional activator/TolB-like protein
VSNERYLRVKAALAKVLLMPAFHLYSLGGLRLHGPEGELLRGRRKDLVLLVYLARRAPRAVPRQELAALLWGERGEARARQSLRQALYTLHAVLGDRLDLDPEYARLGEDAVALDAAAFEREVAQDQLADAVDRWEGEFLVGLEDLGDDVYRSWLEAEREGLRHQLGWALGQLVAEAERRRAWEDAARWAERWAAAFTFDEVAHTHLVNALAELGRTAEALACHAAFSARLREHLETEPSPAFLALGNDLQRLPAGGRSPGSAALLAPDLVGRDDALAALEAAWSHALDTGTVVLVEGEEGIGRTRLCREFLRRLRALPEAPPLVLEAQACEQDTETPWSTARRLFTGIARAPGLSGAPDRALAELSTLVPSLRSRYPDLPPPDGGAEAVAPATARVLEDVAVEAPVLLFLDALDRADPATRGLLLTLAREVPRGVLLLVTRCSNGFDAIDASVQDAPTLRRLKLRSLSEAELETMLDSMLPLDAVCRHDLALRLHAETGGNPLYTVELVSALADAGILAPDPAGTWRVGEGFGSRDLPMSSGLRAAIQTRIEGLPAPARQLMEAAAALGTDLTPSLLQQVSALPSSSFVGAVDELVARRLLRPPESDGGDYEFTQALIRRVAYESLTKPRRRALHGAALRALVGQGAPAGRVRSHRERAGLLPPPIWVRLHPRASIAGLIAVAVSAGALLMGLHMQSPAVSAGTVVVFPFTVQGSEEFGYVGDALANLLATSIDGAPALRTIDPLRVPAVAGAAAQAGLDPHRARLLAARLGAALFVLGTIVESGGRVQATAHLYDAEGGRRAVARAVAERDSDLFELTDALARELLAGLHTGTRGELARVAASTTTSLAAFKDYLAGEDALRRGQYDEAMAAFHRALAGDSTFALASYRMAVTAEWRNDRSALEEALQRALRQRDRLPERYRLLAAADSARHAGAAGEAERRYRGVLALHPDEALAWYNLGEVLIHFNPLRGRPMAEAAMAFERALEYDPDNYEARWHLAQLAASAADTDALERWVEPLLAGGESDRLTWRALGSILSGDSTAIRVDRDALNDAPDDVAYTGAWLVPLLLRNLDEGVRRATAVTLPGRAPEWRAGGHLLAAHAQLARGRWAAAMDEIQAGERLDLVPSLAYRAFFSTLPFAPTLSTETLAGVRDDLLRWDPVSAAPSNVPHLFVSLHDGAHAHLRLYLLGLISARLGEPAEAQKAVAELRRLGAAPHADALAADLALAVESEVVRLDGDDVRALALLEAMQLRPSTYGATFSPFYSHARERFVRAELLFALGRSDEALRWSASVAESPPFGYIFLAPSLLRRAAHHAERGENDSASALYGQFFEIWSDADSALRPTVEQARQQLVQLRRALR